MPIRPENRARYPKTWRTMVAELLGGPLIDHVTAHEKQRGGHE